MITKEQVESYLSEHAEKIRERIKTLKPDDVYDKTMDDICNDLGYRGFQNGGDDDNDISGWMTDALEKDFGWVYKLIMHGMARDGD